jgi:hypothetical protein
MCSGLRAESSRPFRLEATFLSSLARQLGPRSQFGPYIQIVADADQLDGGGIFGARPASHDLPAQHAAPDELRPVVSAWRSTSASSAIITRSVGRRAERCSASPRGTGSQQEDPGPCFGGAIATWTGRDRKGGLGRAACGPEIERDPTAGTGRPRTLQTPAILTLI